MGRQISVSSPSPSTSATRETTLTALHPVHMQSTSTVKQLEFKWDSTHVEELAVRSPFILSLRPLNPKLTSCYPTLFFWLQNTVLNNMLNQDLVLSFISQEDIHPELFRTNKNFATRLLPRLYKMLPPVGQTPQGIRLRGRATR